MTLTQYYTLIQEKIYNSTYTLQPPSAGKTGYYASSGNYAITFYASSTITISKNVVVLGSAGAGGSGFTKANKSGYYAFYGGDGGGGAGAMVIYSNYSCTILNYGAMSGGGGGGGCSINFTCSKNYNYSSGQPISVGTYIGAAGGAGGGGGAGGAGGAGGNFSVGSYGCSPVLSDWGGGAFRYSSSNKKPLIGGLGAGTTASTGGSYGGGYGGGFYTSSTATTYYSGGGGAGPGGNGGNGKVTNDSFQGSVPTAWYASGGGGSGSNTISNASGGKTNGKVTTEFTNGSGGSCQAYFYGGNGGNAGPSIRNYGTIPSLTNIQGLTSTNYLGPITIWGNCPQTYIMLISGENSYGQLFINTISASSTNINTLEVQYYDGYTGPTSTTTYYNVISYYSSSPITISTTSGNFNKVVSGQTYYYGSWSLSSAYISNSFSYYNLTITPVTATGYQSKNYGGKDLANIFLPYTSSSGTGDNTDYYTNLSGTTAKTDLVKIFQSNP